MEQLKVVVCKAGKGISAHIEGLDGFIIAAASFDKLKNDLRKSLDFHISGLYPEEVQPWMNGKYEFTYQFENLDSLLNSLDNIFSQSALARLVGVNEGLMRQYASGVKKPGKKIMQRIETGLHDFGKELNEIAFTNS
jgi:transcriptional regulator with XRE-family HTH domain